MDSYAVAGVLAGVLVILWMSFPMLIDFLLAQSAGGLAHGWGLALRESAHGWMSPFHAFMIPVVGTLVILLVGVLISRFPRGHQRQPEEDSPDA